MIQSASISHIEAGLNAAGISINAVCRRANMPTSTWHRWKNRGVEPRGISLMRLGAAIEQLAPGALLPDYRRSAPLAKQSAA